MHRYGDGRCHQHRSSTAAVANTATPKSDSDSDSDDDHHHGPIIVDCGSLNTIAGFGCDQTPVVNLRSVVALSVPNGQQKKCTDDYFFGDAAFEQSRFVHMRVRYPIEYGIVTDWEIMEKFWHHLFYSELRVCPEEHPIMMTEAPMNPKANRERMTQIMFETFNCPAFYLGVSSVLALFAAGRTTGLVFESGHGANHAIPVYEGYMLPHAVSRHLCGGSGGSAGTDYLYRALRTRLKKERTEAAEEKEREDAADSEPTKTRNGSTNVAGEVAVMICTASGETMTVHAQRNDTILSVKESLEKQGGYRVASQTLYMGGDGDGDDAQLSDRMAVHEALSTAHPGTIPAPAACAELHLTVVIDPSGKLRGSHLISFSNLPLLQFTSADSIHRLNTSLHCSAFVHCSAHNSLCTVGLRLRICYFC
jgi:hypothetical protein